MHEGVKKAANHEPVGLSCLIKEALLRDIP